MAGVPGEAHGGEGVGGEGVAGGAPGAGARASAATAAALPWRRRAGIAHRALRVGANVGGVVALFVLCSGSVAFLYLCQMFCKFLLLLDIPDSQTTSD